MSIISNVLTWQFEYLCLIVFVGKKIFNMKALNIAILLELFTAVAVSAGTSVATEAKRVSVFIDGAQVERAMKVEVPAGASTVAFTGLSPYIDGKSVQVKASGNVTIMGVSMRVCRADSAVAAKEEARLRAEYADVESQLAKRQAALEVAQSQRELLRDNCTLPDNMQNTSLSVVKALNDYYATEMLRLKQEELSIGSEISRLNDRKSELARQMNGQGVYGKEKRMGEIIVEVEASRATTVDFELAYYVGNARWFPSYDIRSDGTDRPMEVIYKANVLQNTEEQWKNVELSLSSAIPTQGNVVPRPVPYRIGRHGGALDYSAIPVDGRVRGRVVDGSGSPLVGASVMVAGSTIGAVTGADGRYSLTLPSDAEWLEFSYVGCESQKVRANRSEINVALRESALSLNEVAVESTSLGKMLESRVAGVSVSMDEASAPDADLAAGPAATAERTYTADYSYRIATPVTVEGGNLSRAVEIGRWNLPAVYSYICRPRIEKTAYLVAEIPKFRTLEILDGEANVFFENTFVGSTVVDMGEASDTLRLSLGRDKGIVVERRKTADRVGKKLLGGTETAMKEWTISLKNTHSETVTVAVEDQVPVSSESEIAVTVEELSGGRLDKATGYVAWEMTLPPGESKSVTLRYVVKYPKEMHLRIE